MFEIDARGFSCPEPVILAKKAIEDGEEVIEVKVKGDFARDNVIRMAESLGCSTSQEAMEGHFLVRIEAGQGRKIRLSGAEEAALLFIRTDSIGDGSAKLGSALMKSFINGLSASGFWIEKIILMNAGVKLASSSSPVIDGLKELESLGAEVLSCGTCLDYYGLKEDLVVGKISNMYDITESFKKAEKILSI